MFPQENGQVKFGGLFQAAFKIPRREDFRQSEAFTLLGRLISDAPPTFDSFLLRGFSGFWN
jgi:hypothetical protein